MSANNQTGLQPQVRAKAELAVAQFQQQAGGRLDYSEKSLLAVDEMLGDASRYKDQMPGETFEAIVELVGSYILDVAYRQYGGVFQWHPQHKQPVLVVGEPQFHVAMMTFDKVRGRLSGDPADNIPFFFQGFAEKVKTATPGMRALYV